MLILLHLDYKAKTRLDISGHFKSVTAVAFSPDSKILASASDDSTIKLLDTGSGALQQTLSGHLKSVTAMVFSLDSKTLASASWNSTIKLWGTGLGAL